MGHGWGSHGGTWSMGTWGQNIVIEMLHVLVGICFRGLGCPNIETHAESPIET
jgi:hypothetical protein